MTIDEAIKIWQYVKDHPTYDSDIVPIIQEACDMAIKALEQEPCEDAISRQAVLEAIDVKAWEFCDYLISKNRNDEQKPVSHFADNLRECVREELPPVNPQEPKTGHWILLDECSNSGYYCSECQKKVVKEGWSNTVKKIKYCPNCGANMSENPTGSKDVQKQDAEIKVGDEVITKIGNKGVVIMDVPCEDGSICVWFPTCNRVQIYPVKDLSKTGRHFDQITEVLAEMRGEE